MTVSILLRLVPAELAHGRLVGRLRVVATGEERLFRDAGELAEVAAEALTGAAATTHAGGGPTPHGETPPDLDAPAVS